MPQTKMHEQFVQNIVVFFAESEKASSPKVFAAITSVLGTDLRTKVRQFHDCSDGKQHVSE